MTASSDFPFIYFSHGISFFLDEGCAFEYETTARRTAHTNDLLDNSAIVSLCYFPKN
jgi:hypothetical protein